MQARKNGHQFTSEKKWLQHKSEIRNMKNAIFLISFLQHLKDFINCDEKREKFFLCINRSSPFFMCALSLEFPGAFFACIERAHLHINQYYVRCVFHVHTHNIVNIAGFSSKATLSGCFMYEALMKNCNDEELCGWNIQRSASGWNVELHICSLMNIAIDDFGVV